MANVLIEGRVREMDLDAGSGRLVGTYSGTNTFTSLPTSVIYRQLVAAFATRQRIVLVRDSVTLVISEVIFTNTPSSDI